MRIIIAFLLFLISIKNWGQQERTQLDSVIHYFYGKQNNFNDEKDVYGSYTLEITIEAILDYTLLTNDTAYMSDMRKIFRKRNYHFTDTISYQKLPFSNPYFTWYRLFNNPEFIAPFVYESIKMRNELKRTPEGAICIHHKDGDYMLIDYLQEYASRMAKCGYLSGDTTFYGECVKQFRIYRDLLQDKNIKLYSQGRGWLPDKNEISPGIWSRGQGWLIRGMVSSLIYLPPNSIYYNELRSYLEELANALLKKQDDAGMWHTLLHLNNNESFPETSGTGMISGYLALSYYYGFLPDKKYKKAALKSSNALLTYLDSGSVTYVSKGPGPLRSIDEYKAEGKDKEHGSQAIIYALTGNLLLKQMNNK
jgi:rhamnogalacturonyl hydrolase YesR